jgi:tRNA A-37 threonylcarbamoyl transferase component Bud32
MPDFDAPTQDHPPREPGSAKAPAPDSFLPDRRLVEGSGFRMDAETRRLLQQRLRAASLVLVLGFGLFFVRSLCLNGLESLSVLFHGLLLALLLLSLALLSSSWRPTLRELRIFEVVLFATLIVCFMAAQYVLMLRRVRWDDPLLFLAAVKSSVLWTFTLILTYAIFIPNTWRRAAKVIVPMALAPMVVPWVLGMVHPESYEVAIRAADLEQVSEHGVFLLLGAFTAIFGTHNINTLRTEAFTARLQNQYQLGRKLGGGGMGEVYLAEHQMLKRPCAIKLIRQERSGEAHAMARFEREVRATAQLSHWNTIEIFDYGRNDDGTFYYVMEYLPGLSLDVLVRRHGPLPPARVIYLLRQACEALNEAHGVGLIHRDIKPGNLFAAYRGGRHDVTKLLDFGLVKTLQGNDAIQLSQEDMIAGSPLYVAPEQVLHSQPPDRRADIYSLGAVAYFLLTGRPPFLGESAFEVMLAHTQEVVVPPSEIRPGIPGDLEQVVLRCLAKKPAERFPDAASLAEALGACADAASWSPRHAAEWWQAHPIDPESAEPVAAEQNGRETAASGDVRVESVSGAVLESVEASRST